VLKCKILIKLLVITLFVAGAVVSVGWATNGRNGNHLRLDGVTIYKTRNTSHLILSIFCILTYILNFYLKLNLLYIYKLNYFDFACNTSISFKEHLPEDAHNRRPKHVACYAVYNKINVHNCICNFMAIFLIRNTNVGSNTSQRS